MDDQCDMNIVERSELAEESNDAILLMESVIHARIASAHHKLQVINNDVTYIVHVGCVLHCLSKETRK